MRLGEVQGEVQEKLRSDLQCEVFFMAKRELGDVGIQGGPVPHPEPQPQPHHTSNLTPEMHFCHVKWF